MKAVIRPAARDDILRQFRYYLVEQEVPEIAMRFLEAVDASIERLLPNPSIGAPKLLKSSLLAGLRSWPVDDFEDIRIYYLVRGETLRVVRVLHGKRDVQRILAKSSPA